MPVMRYDIEWVGGGVSFCNKGPEAEDLSANIGNLVGLSLVASLIAGDLCRH